MPSENIPSGFADVWVRLELTGDPEPMYTHIGVETSLSLSVANTEDLLDYFGGGIATIITSEYTITGGHVLWGDAADPIRLDGTVTIAGSYAGSACPQNTSLLVRKRTILPGRKGRGRMFIPGVPESQVGAQGMLSSGYRASVQTVLDAWEAETTLFQEMVLFHPITGPSDILSLEAAPVVATQRRRLRK